MRCLFLFLLSNITLVFAAKAFGKLAAKGAKGGKGGFLSGMVQSASSAVNTKASRMMDKAINPPPPLSPESQPIPHNPPQSSPNPQVAQSNQPIQQNALQPGNTPLDPNQFGPKQPGTQHPPAQSSRTYSPSKGNNADAFYKTYYKNLYARRLETFIRRLNIDPDTAMTPKEVKRYREFERAVSDEESDDFPDPTLPMTINQ